MLSLASLLDLLRQSLDASAAAGMPLSADNARTMALLLGSASGHAADLEYALDAKLRQPAPEASPAVQDTNIVLFQRPLPSDGGDAA